MPHLINLAAAAIASDPLIMGPLIDANKRFVPEFEVIPTKVIPGRSYKTLVCLNAFSASFRSIGEGTNSQALQFAVREHNMFHVQERVTAIKTVANEFDRSAGRAAGDLFSIAASKVTKAVIELFGTQVFYGTATGLDKGYQGLKAFTPKGGTYTLDATGSTADTASSIYLAWLDPADEEAVCFLTGNDTVLTLPPPRLESVSVTNEDGSTGQTDGWVSQMEGFQGLRIGSQQAVVRICNITAQTGKTATDELLAQAIAKFPIGYRPTHIFMSRRSQEQIRVSRQASSITTLNPQGSPISVPPPTDYYGIPFVVTDSILNTDAIEA